MASAESLLLDGVQLNDRNGAFVVRSVSMPPPAKRYEWAQSADADGSELVRDPLHENRTISIDLRVNQAMVNPATTMDQALDLIGQIVGKLEEAEQQQDGLPLVWTPANATSSVTFDVLSGEINDVPVTKTGDDRGWFRTYPVVKLTLTCKPFAYGDEIAGYTDAFTVDSTASYTADNGSVSNFAVTGGVLDAAANLTVRSDLIQTAYGYLLSDVRVTAKVGVGATRPSFRGGVIVKRPSTNNHVVVEIVDNGTTSTLNVVTNLAGTRTTRQSTSITRITTNTPYWVRGRIEGNVIFGELWTAAPTATGTPAATATFTLTGSDATTLGTGVQGRQGLTMAPQDTGAYLDDLVVEPNVYATAAPILTAAVADVPGDVPGLGRLVVTETANQSRRHIVWGLQQRFYDAATSLQLNSGSMVTSGFAGTSTTRTGSYNANVVRGTLLKQAIAVVGTGSLAHVGDFRVIARAYVSTADVLARLAWQDGDGPFFANGWAAPPVVGAWAEVDLGTITLEQATGGTQRWTGRIEAYSATVGDTLDIDYLLLIPAGEGYGKARAAYAYRPGVTSAYDSFDALTPGAALNGQSATVGGTWATSDSGAGADLVAVNGPASVDHTLTRSTAGNDRRVAILGTATPAAAEVSIDFLWTAIERQVDVYARYTSTTAKLQAWAKKNTDGRTALNLTWFNGGSQVQVGTVVAALAPNAWYRLLLTAWPSGRAIATLYDTNAAPLGSVTMTDPVLATGGALATGKVGFADTGINASTGYYDNFVFAVPSDEPVVLFAGEQAEFRSDGDLAVRQDSGGTVFGRVPQYRGSRFAVPPAGDANRTSRILVKARRNDTDVAADDQVTDNLTVAVAVTPRYLAVPH